MKIFAKIFLMLSVFLLPAGIYAAGVISGTAYCGGPMAKASIAVFDAEGRRQNTVADQNGRYTIASDSLTAPVLILAVESGIPNFSDESRFRGKSVSALLSSLKKSSVNTANVNPISDRVVSDVAKKRNYKGPVGLILSGTTAGISAALIREKTDSGRALIQQALVDAKVKDAENWDPCTSVFSKQAESVLQCIRHNRGYETATGEIGDTMLFDINFRPLSPADVLDYRRALAEKAALADKSISHIYIAADSTGCYYESERAPRAGWGQILQSKFKDDAKIMVVNAAQSGRSSRTFINEGWLRMIEETILPGDVFIIQFGHNDEKGGSVKPAARDVFDIANTATYPNDAAGKMQGGDLSFQRWLEKYIALAKNKKAIPVLLTPTTRIKLAQDKKTGVFPIKQSTHINDSSNSGAAYLGDFSQTIRDTAKANGLICIDIDAMTMAFANSAGEPGWKNYWLAVDPAKYPFYGENVAGNILRPDATHFQTAGASKISDFVIEGFRTALPLADFAKKAK